MKKLKNVFNKITISVAVYVFYANEASKEVYFLCGNFKQGTALDSVIKQLATTNLSQYQILPTAEGKQIIHSSLINFHFFRCTININDDGRVESAYYE